MKNWQKRRTLFVTLSRGLSSDSSRTEQPVYVVNVKKGEIYGRCLNVAFTAIKNDTILA